MVSRGRASRPGATAREAPRTGRTRALRNARRPLRLVPVLDESRLRGAICTPMGLRSTYAAARRRNRSRGKCRPTPPARPAGRPTGRDPKPFFFFTLSFFFFSAAILFGTRKTSAARCPRRDLRRPDDQLVGDPEGGGVGYEARSRAIPTRELPSNGRYRVVSAASPSSAQAADGTCEDSERSHRGRHVREGLCRDCTHLNSTSFSFR